MDRRIFYCNLWMICVWDGFAQPHNYTPYVHTGGIAANVCLLAISCTNTIQVERMCLAQRRIHRHPEHYTTLLHTAHNTGCAL